MIVLKTFLESFIMAIQELMNNKLRSFLSLLGISIGILCVITVLSAVDSLQLKFQTSINKLGDNVVYFSKWPWNFDNPNYEWWEYLKRKNPDLNELKYIQDNIVSADYSALEAVKTAKEISYESNVLQYTELDGITGDYDKVREMNIRQGRFFSSMEFTNALNVCILGSTVAEKLFTKNEYPIGKFIKHNGAKLQVVGVLEQEGTNLIGASMDGIVFVPYLTFSKFYNVKILEGVNCMIRAKNGVSIEQLIDELMGSLRTIRRIKPREDEDFALNQISLLAKLSENIFKSLNAAGWIIGGFAILVGCFGVANIMFVSVKERTNIIGIKKSLGAKNYIILLEFLFEAIVLCIFGGLFGLFSVYVILSIGNKMLDLNLILSTKNVMYGLVVSTVSGILAGIIPAISASQMNPVDAIRSK